MAQNHRLAHAHRAETAIVKIVQIGPANAACANANGHLPLARRRHRDRLDAQILGCVDDGGEVGTHGMALLVCKTLSASPVSCKADRDAGWRSFSKLAAAVPDQETLASAARTASRRGIGATAP